MQEQEVINSNHINGKVFKPSDVFGGLPEDNIEEVETPEINKDDFEEATIVEETNTSEGVINDEKIHRVKGEDVHTEKELEEKAKAMKKKFVKMLNPKTVVRFAEMFITRAGSMAMVRTEKKDWRLDPDELEFLIDCFEVMVEEEEIELWPAKYWLLAGLIFILALKVYDNYKKYYSQKSIEEKAPELIEQEAQKIRETELAEIIKMEQELELLERRSKVEKRKRQITEAIEKGLDVDDLNHKKEVKENAEALELLKLKEEYPEEDYWWKDGVLQYNLDGTVAKRRGARPGTKRPIRQHPVTKKFLSEEDYQQLVASGEIIEEATLV